jgi:purine-binding chemotaxis protein CheW
MNVKEIAKADKFTYVPNAASFVRGVYNLRGDIIAIIDLRIFFHLPQETKADGQEHMLILRINEQVYGTIVDKIDKVVGINHESIQPPHPIFGDINIKFISGVVEKAGDLYIILDVVRIFGQKEEDKEKDRVTTVSSSGTFYVPPPQAADDQTQEQQAAATDTAIGFVKETLLALRQFTSSPVNEKWLQEHFAEWSTGKVGNDLQLRGASDADEFLASFTSPCSEAFWDDDYVSAFIKVLPKFPSNVIQLWNIGCGKGYETFSIACALKGKYPDAQIKIWANDKDIMAISQAPNIIFDLDEVPEYCREYMVKGKSGYSFNQVIKDSIIFEYHDILNENPLPALDVIVARDLLSYFSIQEQNTTIDGFAEKLKSAGLVILGTNEELSGEGWNSVSIAPVSAFVRNA